jgi:translation elongation factor EF-4
MCKRAGRGRAQISAKRGDGVDELLETVLLMAEVEQLTANPSRAARGTVIEAHLDRRQGAVAALLVANGTLRVGDVVQAGATFGRVRALAGVGAGRTRSGRRVCDAAWPDVASGTQHKHQQRQRPFRFVWRPAMV